MKEMGYTVNSPNCAAKLIVNIDGSALSESYQVNDTAEHRTCYTGAKFDGEVTLITANGEQKTEKVSEAEMPPSGITVCPGEDSAPFREVAARALLKVLEIYYGDETLVMAQKVDFFAGIRETIDSMHPSDTLIDGLIGLLNDPDPQVRYNAAAALDFIEPFPIKAAKPCVDRIKIETATDPNVVMELWTVLIDAGPMAKLALPDLIEMLNKGGSGERLNAAQVIERMDDVGRPAAPALVAALKDPEPWARIWSARALGKIGDTSTETIAALLEVLADPDTEAAGSAARSLAALTGQPDDFFQVESAWKSWWQSYQKTVPTPTPTLKPEQVMTIQAPPSFYSLWTQWNHRYVVYINRNAGIENFSDFEGKYWYIGLMGANPANFDLAAMASDFQPLQNIVEVHIYLYPQGGPTYFKSYLVGSAQGAQTDLFYLMFENQPDYIGVMVPEVAEFYHFGQNENLIRVEFTAASSTPTP
jgi:hypothetical protein